MLTFCLISELSRVKKEDGYKQKGKQSVSPQLKLCAVNKGSQSAIGRPQTNWSVYLILDKFLASIFSHFDPNASFPLEVNYFTTKPPTPLFCWVEKAHLQWKRQDGGEAVALATGSRCIPAAFDPSFPMTSTKEWARAVLRIELCYCSPRHRSSIWGAPAAGELFYPWYTPGLFLYSAAMLCWVISLELDRDISRSTSLQMTADSLVMTDLETIMTGNCLIRTGIFHEDNYIIEARGHVSLGSPLFWPSPSCWLSAPSALPSVTHSGLFILVAGIIQCTTKI